MDFIQLQNKIRELEITQQYGEDKIHNLLIANCDKDYMIETLKQEIIKLKIQNNVLNRKYSKLKDEMDGNKLVPK